MLSQGGTYPFVNEIKNNIVREREREIRSKIARVRTSSRGITEEKKKKKEKRGKKIHEEF